MHPRVTLLVVRCKMIFAISAIIGGLILIYLVFTIALPEKF